MFDAKAKRAKIKAAVEALAKIVEQADADMIGIGTEHNLPWTQAKNLLNQLDMLGAVLDAAEKKEIWLAGKIRTGEGKIITRRDAIQSMKDLLRGERTYDYIGGDADALRHFFRYDIYASTI